jgi:hypothetical protein
MCVCTCVCRLKDVAEEQFSQAEADRGAGKSKEVLPPVRR